VVVCCFGLSRFFFFFWVKGSWGEFGRGIGGHHVKLKEVRTENLSPCSSYGMHSLTLPEKLPLSPFPVHAGEMPSGVGVSPILTRKNSTYHFIWVAWVMGVFSRACVLGWGRLKVEQGHKAA
jgi:hypothetical protein